MHFINWGTQNSSNEPLGKKSSYFFNKISVLGLTRPPKNKIYQPVKGYSMPKFPVTFYTFNITLHSFF